MVEIHISNNQYEGCATRFRQGIANLEAARGELEARLRACEINDHARVFPGHPETAAQLLAHYSMKDVNRFRQYDGYEHDPMIPEAEGDVCSWEPNGAGHELMGSGWTVRVLIDANAKADDVCRLLRHVTRCIEEDYSTEVQPGDMAETDLTEEGRLSNGI